MDIQALQVLHAFKAVNFGDRAGIVTQDKKIQKNVQTKKELVESRKLNIVEDEKKKKSKGENNKGELKNLPKKIHKQA